MFHFLLLFILINLGFLLWGRIGRGFFRDPVYNGILAVDAALALYSITADPKGTHLATWLALGIFFGAVVVPLILGRFINSAVNDSNLSRVQRLLQIKYIFQPSVDVAEQIKYNRKVLKAYKGEIKEIVREIERELGSSTDGLQRQLLLESLVEINVFAGKWREGLDIYKDRIAGRDAVLKPTLYVTVARAASELGEWDLMWDAYRALSGGEFSEPDPMVRRAIFYVQVMLLAVYGKSGALRKILKPMDKGDPLFPLAPKRYWLGTSYLAEGKEERGHELLTFSKKLQSISPTFHDAALERKRSGFTKPPKPGLNEQMHLQRIRLDMERVSEEKPLALATPWVGKGLIIFTMAVFALQLWRSGMAFEFSGAQAMRDLFWIGGNFRGRTLAMGEYWRLVTAMFLHGGFIHIFFNLYVIWIFAPLLEVHYGRLKFLLIVLFSGIGGNLLSTIVEPAGVAVGVSGVVFGLVGAMFIMLIIHRDRFPEAWRRRQLSLLVFLLIINVAIGLSMDIIDNSAHGGGLVSGMVVAALLGGQMDRRLYQRVLSWGLAVLAGAIVIYSAWGVYDFNRGKRMEQVTLKSSSDGAQIAITLPKFWQRDHLVAVNQPVAPGHKKPKVPFVYEPFCRGDNRIVFFSGEMARIQHGEFTRSSSLISHDALSGWERFKFRFGSRQDKEFYIYYKEFEQKYPLLVQVIYGQKCAQEVSSVLPGLLESVRVKKGAP